MKKILLLLVVCLSLCSCKNNFARDNKSYVISEEIDKIMSENSYVIVDVRTKEEYDTGHIKGSINIPYDSIDDSITLDKKDKILVYCKSGARSTKAYETLTNLGYTVYNLGAYDNINLPQE